MGMTSGGQGREKFMLELHPANMSGKEIIPIMRLAEMIGTSHLLPMEETIQFLRMEAMI
jgi:hypothetical protein